MQVLYLIFTEGHTASAGEHLHRVDLSGEAIRLARELHAQVPEDGEISGLLALMVLHHARHRARTGPDGGLIPLAQQDRSLWDRRAIAEGIGLVTAALATSALGPYQLQAAIAAVHAEAEDPEATDWSQILGLYDHLVELAPGPMVWLGRVVALSVVEGPRRGLAELARLEQDPSLRGHHRVSAVRAHLLDLSGETRAAADAFARAAELTLSIPEQRYLEAQAVRLNST